MDKTDREMWMTIIVFYSIMVTVAFLIVKFILQ